MVFAIPESNWEQFESLCASESVEATVIGQFKPTGQLVLKFGDETVGDVSMSMLHDGRPPIIREATYQPVPASDIPSFEFKTTAQWTTDLCKILASPNVASKH